MFVAGAEWDDAAAVPVEGLTGAGAELSIGPLFLFGRDSGCGDSGRRSGRTVTVRVTGRVCETSEQM